MSADTPKLSGLCPPDDFVNQRRLCCRLDLATAHWVQPGDLCARCRARRQRLLRHTCPGCGRFAPSGVRDAQGVCARCADPDPLF